MDWWSTVPNIPTDFRSQIRITTFHIKKAGNVFGTSHALYFNAEPIHVQIKTNLHSANVSAKVFIAELKRLGAFILRVYSIWFWSHKLWWYACVNLFFISPDYNMLCSPCLFCSRSTYMFFSPWKCNCSKNFIKMELEGQICKSCRTHHFLFTYHQPFCCIFSSKVLV